MIELRRLLCPVDFSEPSRRALRHAIAIARRYGSELTVLYVEDVMQTAARAEMSLGASIAATPDDWVRAFLDATPGATSARITVATRLGGAVTGILEQARADSSDLIVIGTHGRSGLARVLLGSVTDSVLRQASCPVMTIPTAVDGPADEEVEAFDPVLCASDFSPACRKALGLAVSVAQEADARLIVLNALEIPALNSGLMPLQPVIVDPVDHTEWRRETLDRLRNGLPDDAGFRCHPEVMVVPGSPSETILRVAEERQVNLIVMGVHSRSAIDRMLFGSTTRQVIQAARCPVLTVRATPHDEPWAAASNLAQLPAATTA